VLFIAHHVNLDEDRPILFAVKCSTGTLDFGNTAYADICGGWLDREVKKVLLITISSQFPETWAKLLYSNMPFN